MNVLEPVFERQFIFHTYACRKGKVTHAAARCLELLFGVIDSYKIDFEADADGRKKKSLSIGNLTSQFFANFCLSALDHFILEKLKPEGYVRYMDDMVIFDDSNKNLKTIFDEVKHFCFPKQNAE